MIAISDLNFTMIDSFVPGNEVGMWKKQFQRHGRYRAKIRTLAKNVQILYLILLSVQYILIVLLLPRLWERAHWIMHAIESKWGWRERSESSLDPTDVCCTVLPSSTISASSTGKLLGMRNKTAHITKFATHKTFSFFSAALTLSLSAGSSF